MAHRIGIVEIDLHYLGQGKITLAVPWRTNFAFYCITGAQTELADHIWGYVNIIWTRQIIGLGRTQKAKAVRQNLNRTQTHDLLAIFGKFFQDRKHKILFAQGGRAFDTQLFSHRYEVSRIFAFQLFQMHRKFRWVDAVPRLVADMKKIIDRILKSQWRNCCVDSASCPGRA